MSDRQWLLVFFSGACVGGAIPLVARSDTELMFVAGVVLLSFGLASAWHELRKARRERQQ